MNTTDCARKDISFSAAPKRNHLLLMVAFFFLLGCIFLPYTTGGVWLWALAAAGAGLIILLKHSGMRCGVGVAVLCFALGLLHAHAAFDAAAPEEGRYEISGFVYGDSIPRTDDRIAFVLGDIQLDGRPVSGRAYCTLHYDEGPPELFDGAQLVFTGRVYHPDGKTGEPRVDFRLWMRQHGYHFGIAAYEGVQIGNTQETAPVRDAAHRVRQVFDRAFRRTMGENGRIAMALLFGQRGGLSDEEYASFQKLGIAHIMSVSGLHVGLVGSMLTLLLDRTRLKKRTRLIILCFFLVDYCALTGFSAASVRAAVMLVCASLARLCHRRGDSITTLAAAMLIVLVIDPLSALSAGFVLSFGAMLGIILFARPVAEAFDRLWPAISPDRHSLRTMLSRLQRGIRSALAVAIAAQLGVLLPTMRYFQQLPLYGVLINLFIVPFVTGILVPAYLLTLGLSLFPWLGQLAGFISSALTDLLLALVQLLSKLPCASIRTSAPPVIVCIALAASGMILSRRMPGRFRTRLLASVLTAAVALGGWMLDRPADLRYIQLSVGQADAALLMDRDKTIVIDTGADGSAVIDYLMHENRNIDALILTHLHLDHSGGVPALLESGVNIHRVYLPPNAALQKLDEEALAVYELLLASDIPLSTLASGDELRYNKSSIRVLWPERGTVRTGHDANDYPLVLSIDLDGFILLNASDVTGLYEQYAAAPADVLKLAHHGSAESTLDDFLDFVTPQYALLSVAGSSRSLPGAETLERLDSRGIAYFRTDECGDITLAVEDGALTITPYLERKSP